MGRLRLVRLRFPKRNIGEEPCIKSRKWFCRSWPFWHPSSVGPKLAKIILGRVSIKSLHHRLPKLTLLPLRKAQPLGPKFRLVRIKKTVPKLSRQSGCYGSSPILLR
jgi:hypothetical protein